MTAPSQGPFDILARSRTRQSVKDDVIEKELAEIVQSGGVDPGVVIPIGSGELAKTHQVKKIFHAAAVKGQVGRGYSSIPDIGECMRNALKLADSEEMATEDIHSILFPLMGTGTTKLDAEEVAMDLISAAISYLEENKNSRINKVFFLAFNEQDKEICEHIYSLFIKKGRLQEGSLITDA